MNTASLFRHLIVVCIALAIALVYIFVNFKGLDTADGMEKAQLGREIARGAYKTKVIRPVAIGQFSKKHQRDPLFREVAATDSYNSPLYPLVLGGVFKLVGGDDFEKSRMGEETKVYYLDRVICVLSVLFYFGAAFMIYLFARKSFDGTIAGLTFLIVITCEMFWKFTQTGMPNCLMLFLFSSALYFIYLGSEKSSQDNKGGAYFFGTLGGIFLILLCMTHWMGVWLLLGFFIYSFFFIKPAGGVAGTVVVLSLMAFAFPLLQNYNQTGNPFGTAFYSLYVGLGTPNELIMRSGDPSDFIFSFREITLTIIRNILSQLTKTYEYMGFIIAAPLFFLSLIHKYKNHTVNNFRWAILLMWIFAVIGMSIYGIGDDAFYSKQLHYLFAPIMAVYGLSIVAILWGRLSLGAEMMAFRFAHFAIIGVLACAPILLSVTKDALRGGGGGSNWPPYAPVSMNEGLNLVVGEEEYIFSDQPWAVAWYADRNAIWTPYKIGTIKLLEDIAREKNEPIAGIHVSPSSFGEESFYDGYIYNREIAALALDGWAAVISEGKFKLGDFARVSESSSHMIQNYPYPVALNGALMTYYSAERPQLKK